MFTVDPKEVIRAFTELPKNVARKVVRQALRDTCKLIAAEVKARAPVDTGTLRRNVKVRATRKSRKSIGMNIIIGGVAWYAVPVHFGHGGSHPALEHPFAREAFEARKQDATDLLVRELRDGIVREYAALATAS